jgi:fructoselysine-6-P-deglycase FrlB-like protein
MTLSMGGRGEPVDPLLAEILEQPDVVADAGRSLRNQTSQLTGIRAACTGQRASPLILTGMGSSLHALHALETILCRAGHHAYAVNTAELVHFRLHAMPRQRRCSRSANQGAAPKSSAW